MPLKDFVHSRTFSNTVLLVIIANALLLGIETYTPHRLIRTLQQVCLCLFVVEIGLRFIYRKSTHSFFSDTWNIFDIIVVGAAFIPSVGGVTTSLRVLRVFRVLRIIKGIPELRRIVSVLARSFVSMGYIGLLLVVVLYVYAVVGVQLFGRSQPEFATLHESCFSLFRILTGDDWVSLHERGITRQDYWVVTIYHVSWIILSAFVMLNLVIGAIVDHYGSVREDERPRRQECDEERLLELVDELNRIVKQGSKGDTP
ncbi:MAG: ion transporter [Phycisphaerae bacterium]|nr:ion transporter [Phycisphaerae bacterium]